MTEQHNQRQPVHDLRNDLAVILNVLSLLQEDPQTPEHQQRLVDLALQATQRARQTLNQMPSQ